MNWNKCLLICFLCFFPSKLIIDILTNYLKSYTKQKIKINLSKKILFCCYQSEEKAQQHQNIIRETVFEIVPAFANQFCDYFFSFWKFLIEIGLEIYILFFRLKVSNSSPAIKWVIIEFLLAILFSYLFFTLIVNKLEKQNQRKKEKNYLLEKQQIGQFLNNPQKIGKLLRFIKENQKQKNLSSLHSTFSQLANLMIPGISISFIFFYYQTISQDFYNNIWTVFFIAWSIQRIFFSFRSLMLLKPSFFQKKASQIKNLVKVLK